MLLSSAYGFSQEAAKTSDHYFTGFPSYWNIVVFYLVVLGAPPAVNAAVLIGLAVLVFVPIAYVYPSRTPTLRVPTLALGLTWALLVLVMIWQYPGRLASRPLPVAHVPRLLSRPVARARRAEETGLGAGRWAVGGWAVGGAASELSWHEAWSPAPGARSRSRV